MRKPFVAAAWLGAALLSLVGATTVLGHSGGGEEGLQVEPTSVTGGGSVVLAGSGLEPDDERVLVLVGPDLAVQLGTVTTDADGMFSKELAIPSHLPSGTYTFQAIGDETLTVDVAVTAASGAGGDTPAANAAGETVTPRQRSPLEVALLVGVIAALTAAGSLLVWRAERLGGGHEALHTTG